MKRVLKRIIVLLFSILFLFASAMIRSAFAAELEESSSEESTTVEESTTEEASTTEEEPDAYFNIYYKIGGTGECTKTNEFISIERGIVDARAFSGDVIRITWKVPEGETYTVSTIQVYKANYDTDNHPLVGAPFGTP